MLRLVRFAFWAAATFALVMALLPHPPVLPASDKLQHMAAFFVITVLGRMAYPRFPWVKLLLALVAFGGFIELVQEIPELHRDSQLSDWIADIVAVVVALACSSLARPLRASRPE
jgi:VanZ family protein